MHLNIQVERYKLDQVLVKGTVEHIKPVFEHVERLEEKNDRIKEQETEGEAMTVTAKKKVRYFQVKLQEGVVLKARQVVVATGPTRAQMANIPSWVKSIGESYPEDRLQHTVQLMHHQPATRHKLRDMGVPRQEGAEGESSFFLKICIMFRHLSRIVRINSFFLQRLQWLFEPTLSLTSIVCLL